MILLAEQNDFSYTYSGSRYSCIAWMFPIHFFLVAFGTVLGVGAFLTRLVEKYRFMHVWFGRLYILNMLITFFAALFLNNAGTPVAIIWMMIFIVVGVSVGFIVIQFHKLNIEAQAFKIVALKIQENIDAKELVDLAKMIQDAKSKIAGSKTFYQRMVSWKALHGIAFFFPWFALAIRIIVVLTLPPQNIYKFDCYTYPVYKQLNISNHVLDHSYSNGEPLTPLPFEDDNNQITPDTNVSFVLMNFFVILITALAVGIGNSYYFARKVKGTVDSK